MKKLTVITAACLACFSVFGQSASVPEESENPATPHFIEMMLDGSYNFYEVKEEYENYTDTHPNDTRTFNQYNRWAYFMEERSYPSEDALDPTHIWTEVTKFQNDQSNAKAAGANWVEHGPSSLGVLTGHWNPGVGRINVIVRDPNNTSILYVGTPAGGLWKSINDGNSWVPLTDDLPSIGVSGVAIDHTNSNTIYIGTGDKDGGNTPGIGILKSTDNGATWNTTGLTGGAQVNKLLMHPTNNNILFAAREDGLYKTINGGTTWTNVLSGNIDDIEFNPNDPNIVYAISQTFYRSTNGGNSFSSVYIATSGRAQIAVTNANSAYVYFVSQSGIFRSSNNGVSFVKQGNYPGSGSQIWYDLACAVSHTNPNELHVGEIETFASTNGGVSFTQTTQWSWQGSISQYVHADVHEMVFYGGTLYVGSDGLITRSSNVGNTWTNLTNGIGIRQFYRVGGSQTQEDYIMGGGSRQWNMCL